MVHFTIATRRSQLAIIQSQMIERALRQAAPHISAALLPLQTTGDKYKEQNLDSLGGKGVFTKEIENALLQNNAQIAMHSLKDMPIEMPDGLMLAGVLPRDKPEDMLISHRPIASLDDLPRGACIGTSSPRRAAQMRRLRPDISIIPFRGNVPTRLEKVTRGDGVDASLLACAGLARLELIPQYHLALTTTQMLPAIGQGLIALQCRVDDTTTRAAIAAITCTRSWQQAQAERAFLAAIGGDCHSPLAGHAHLSDDGQTLTFRGAVYREDGSQTEEITLIGDVEDAAEIGKECGQKLHGKAQSLWHACS